MICPARELAALAGRELRRLARFTDNIKVCLGAAVSSGPIGTSGMLLQAAVNGMTVMKFILLTLSAEITQLCIK